MAYIIALINHKGGVGKSTIAVNLAYGLKLRAIENKVLLIDSDPQGSTRDWHAANDGTLLDVIGLDRPTLDKDVQKLSPVYDWIVIDGAARLEDMTAAAIKCADLILIPVQPSPYDVWATEDIVELIKTRQIIADGKPKAAFLISRKIPNTILGREIADALAGYDLPALENGTHQRQAYPQAITKGLSVLNTEPKGEAAKEIERLVDEIVEAVK